jgi:hypothetical protein
MLKGTACDNSNRYVEGDGMDLRLPLARTGAFRTGKKQQLGGFLHSCIRRVEWRFAEGIMASFVQGCNTTSGPESMLVFVTEGCCLPLLKLKCTGIVRSAVAPLHNHVALAAQRVPVDTPAAVDRFVSMKCKTLSRH